MNQRSTPEGAKVNGSYNRAVHGYFATLSMTKQAGSTAILSPFYNRLHACPITLAKVVKIYKLSVLCGFNKTKITDVELSFSGKDYKLFARGLLTRAF